MTNSEARKRATDRAQAADVAAVAPRSPEVDPSASGALGGAEGVLDALLLVVDDLAFQHGDEVAEYVADSIIAHMDGPIRALITGAATTSAELERANATIARVEALADTWADTAPCKAGECHAPEIAAAMTRAALASTDPGEVTP